MSGNNELSWNASPKLITVPLGTSEAALYTVAGREFELSHGTVCNTTASALTVYLSLVPAGGTPGDGTHRVIAGYSLAANDTLSLRDYLAGAALGPGDAVYGYASAAGADLVLSGLVYS
jgi:hypothetical protein